jgi:guanylate kinase
MRNLICIVGGSGSGKSTLENELVKRYPDHYIKLISTTTRKPRLGELNGEHYHFVTREQFEKLNFVETAYFGDNHYGVTVDEIYKEPTKDAVLVVEPEGFKTIISWINKNDTELNLICIFIDIPYVFRKERLVSQYGEVDAQKRLDRDHGLDLNFKKFMHSAYGICPSETAPFGFTRYSQPVDVVNFPRMVHGQLEEYRNGSLSWWVV